MCEKSGCHIEEIASDIEATMAADDLLIGRQLLDANGMQEAYREALSKHGFDEWPQAALSLEVQFARFKQRLAEQRERKVKRRKR